MDTALDPIRLSIIFKDCLLSAARGDDQDKMVVVEGITFNAGFAPQRLESYKSEIAAMLAELPGPFQESGGGWSFLNACYDKNDVQWTGEHQVVQELLMLGLATEQAKYCAPRELWESFPGGMPYFVVTPDKRENVQPVDHAFNINENLVWLDAQGPKPTNEAQCVVTTRFQDAHEYPVVGLFEWTGFEWVDTHNPTYVIGVQDACRYCIIFG